MKTTAKCLIINVNTQAVQSLEEAKLIQDLIEHGLVEHAREICDAYNIATEGVHVNYRPIEHNTVNEWEVSQAVELIVLDSFLPAARNFVEEGLFAARRGHVLVTGSIVINFSVVFLNTGSVMLTQEVFKP